MATDRHLAGHYADVDVDVTAWIDGPTVYTEAHGVRRVWAFGSTQPMWIRVARWNDTGETCVGLVDGSPIPGTTQNADRVLVSVEGRPPTDLGHAHGAHAVEVVTFEDGFLAWAVIDPVTVLEWRWKDDRWTQVRTIAIPQTAYGLWDWWPDLDRPQLTDEARTATPGVLYGFTWEELVVGQRHPDDGPDALIDIWQGTRHVAAEGAGPYYEPRCARDTDGTYRVTSPERDRHEILEIRGDPPFGPLDQPSEPEPPKPEPPEPEEPAMKPPRITNITAATTIRPDTAAVLLEWEDTNNHQRFTVEIDERLSWRITHVIDGVGENQTGAERPVEVICPDVLPPDPETPEPLPPEPLPPDVELTTLGCADGIHFVTVDGAEIHARATVGETWHLLWMVRGDLPLVALDTGTGYWLTAELDGSVAVTRSSQQPPGAWETWTLERRDATHAALRSAHGGYLRVEGGGGSTVNAQGPDTTAWQTFTFSIDLSEPVPEPVPPDQQPQPPAGEVFLTDWLTAIWRDEEFMPDYAPLSSDDRREFREVIKSKGYNSLCAWVAYYYEGGGFNFLEKPEEFAQIMREVYDDGLKAIVCIGPEGSGNEGFLEDYPPDKIASKMRTLIQQCEPWIAAVMLGPEKEEYWSRDDADLIGRAIREVTSKPIWTHDQGGTVDVDYEWCTGCCYQVIGGNPSTEQVIHEIAQAKRAAGGKQVLVGETVYGDASWDLEQRAIHLGDTGIRDGGADGSIQAGTPGTLPGQVPEAGAIPPDEIDADEVQFDRPNEEGALNQVRDWPITVHLRKVWRDGDSLMYDFDEPSWPTVNGVRGNLWVARLDGDQWRNEPFDYFKPNQRSKSADDFGWDGWSPDDGELLYGMVSTTARDKIENGEERSQLVAFHW